MSFLPKRIDWCIGTVTDGEKEETLGTFLMVDQRGRKNEGMNKEMPEPRATDA